MTDEGIAYLVVSGIILLTVTSIIIFVICLQHKLKD